MDDLQIGGVGHQGPVHKTFDRSDGLRGAQPTHIQPGRESGGLLNNVCGDTAILLDLHRFTGVLEVAQVYFHTELSYGDDGLAFAHTFHRTRRTAGTHAHKIARLDLPFFDGVLLGGFVVNVFAQSLYGFVEFVPFALLLFSYFFGLFQILIFPDLPNDALEFAVLLRGLLQGLFAGFEFDLLAAVLQFLVQLLVILDQPIELFFALSGRGKFFVEFLFLPL